MSHSRAWIRLGGGTHSRKRDQQGQSKLAEGRLPSSDQDQLPPRLSRWMQQAGPGREPEACRLTQGSAQTPGSQPPSDAGHGQEAAAWGEQKPLWGQSSVLCCPPWALLFPGATSPPLPPPLTGVLPPQASSSCGLRGVPRPLVALGPCNPSSVRQVDPQSVSLWAEVLGQGRERPGRSGLCTLGHGARGAPSRPLLVVPLALFLSLFCLSAGHHSPAGPPVGSITAVALTCCTATSAVSLKRKISAGFPRFYPWNGFLLPT